MRNLGLVLLLCLPIITNAQNDFSFNVEGLGIYSNESENPFWFTANQYGRLDSETSFLGLAEANYTYEGNDQEFQIGGGLLYRDGIDDGAKLDQIFASYTYKWFKATVGFKHRDEKLMGLSSVGGDIIWSNNARALPGVILETSSPIKIWDWFAFRATLAHYELNEDRFVEDAHLHHKSLYLDFSLTPDDIISVGLRHYVQWGGTSPVTGPQPDGFSDFLKIFTGQGGGENASESDQINALGNHLGSYSLEYTMNRDNYSLQFYHQTLFEDSSGRELNNFPDGVWGIFYQPKSSSFISGLLYEYIQTVSQSGRPIPNNDGIYRGGDNYFSSGVYRSGWTYEGRIIGLPFILINDDGLGIKSNRSYVHHLGITGSFWKLNYKLKGTYAKYFGSYFLPLEPNVEAVYGYGEFTYPSNFGDFTLITGGDYSKNSDNIFGVGLKYAYTF